MTWRRPLTVILAGIMAAVGGLAASAGPAQAQVDTNAWYVIQSRHSGKVLDVAGASASDGAAIQQWARADTPNQQFRFIDAGGGYYRLAARHSGKVVDIYEWNAADGAEVVQWTDLNGTNQQFQVVETSDGYVRLVNRFSGKALDVWEWSTADGGRISQYTDHGGTNQQWRLIQVDGGGSTPPTGLVGWASMNGGTTGGAGGPTVTVNSGSALIAEMQSSGPRTIYVQGTVALPSGMHDVASNKSILGASSGATITSGGLDIDGVSNVIIRNITFRDWNDDAINLQDGSTNVWVDHNTFRNGYDGAVDVKRESDFVTISWNRVLDHDKSMLLGHSDGHTADIGNLRVTYHHNWFDGSGTRHPRVRFGDPVHVFNNYYRGNDYGVASTMNAGVLVEGNYFENVGNPTHVGYGSSDPGRLVFRNNVLVNSGSPETAGSVAGIPYSYSMDNANDVRSIVMGGAGAGRITP